MTEILNRYLPYNTHAASYTWKFNGNNIELVNIIYYIVSTGKNLNMNKTLQQNGINDESEPFYELNMDEDDFLRAFVL